MSRSISATFVRDDRETAIEVEFTVVSGGSAPVTCGPPELCDPGEPPEIELDCARLCEGGAPVELTDAERDRLVQEVLELPDLWEPDDGPDPDDWRDQRMDDRLCGRDA